MEAGTVLLLVGGAGVVSSAAVDPASTSAAASQDWPPFVLIAGLLLIGLVAADDRLFAAAGERLALATKDARFLFAGAAALVMVVSATLNLDTAVAFLSPVFVHAARKRGEDEALFLSTCLLLSNAGSLLLPGSNLTNLIVLGHLHLAGTRFVTRMGLPWLAAGVVTAAVIAIAGRRALRHRVQADGEAVRPALGIGGVAVVAAIVLIVFIPSPALPVMAVGVAATLLSLARGTGVRRVLDVLGLPILLGLLGISIGLGTLGRDWAGPANLLGHLDPWATAGVAALASVAVNNLPAASLLAARTPAHPYALLVGLNLGPNLFVTGSLSWILWLKASRAAGGRPSVRQAALIGVVAVPLSIVAAVGCLLLATGQT